VGTIDGKSIKGTVRKRRQLKNFECCLGLQQSIWVVLVSQQFAAKQTSELTVVQNLLAALHLEGGV